ncbi:MAG: ROK family glucokinase [Sporichthyaceae bacterium]
MSASVGVDVGGTKLAAGLVDADGKILTRAQVPSERSDPEATAEQIEAVIAALGEQARGLAVGVGVAGFVAADRSTVARAPNLDWRDVDLGAALRRRLDVPVVVENDANAAAWAEARFGAGRGTHSMVAVTVGTGIGGGIVSHGVLHRGGNGMAAEIGHLPLVIDGKACPCGQQGCWEQYASGTALVRVARYLVDSGKPAAAALREACGAVSADLTGAMVTAAAQAGDLAALHLLGEIGQWLGRGLAALAAVLDPECFVIGGGVVAAGDLVLAPARESFAMLVPAGAERPATPILPAALGNDAGIVGAADLVRSAR